MLKAHRAARAATMGHFRGRHKPTRRRRVTTASGETRIVRSLCQNSVSILIGQGVTAAVDSFARCSHAPVEAQADGGATGQGFPIGAARRRSVTWATAAHPSSMIDGGRRYGTSGV